MTRYLRVVAKGDKPTTSWAEWLDTVSTGDGRVVAVVAARQDGREYLMAWPLVGKRVELAHGHWHDGVKVPPPDPPDLPRERFP